MKVRLSWLWLVALAAGCGSRNGQPTEADARWRNGHVGRQTGFRGYVFLSPNRFTHGAGAAAVPTRPASTH